MGVTVAGGRPVVVGRRMVVAVAGCGPGRHGVVVGPVVLTRIGAPVRDSRVARGVAVDRRRPGGERRGSLPVVSCWCRRGMASGGSGVVVNVSRVVPGR